MSSDSSSECQNSRFAGRGQVCFSPLFCQPHFFGVGCSKPPHLYPFFCCCPSLGSSCRAVQPPTVGEDPAAGGEETPLEPPHSLTGELQTPCKANALEGTGQYPKNGHKAPQPLSLPPPKPPSSPYVQEVAGATFPLGGHFPHNPSKDYAALMSLSPGGGIFSG